jgi:DNA mismatch repair protein MutL
VPIRLLPRQLIDQIAAGEVVERPASAVKELIENALDAGARRIHVEIEGGGVDRLSVTDDGCGIPPEELALAVASHATSKVSTAQDLERISTMGFRGEALASIASVSRLSITSRTGDSEEAWTLAVEGGVVQAAQPAAGPRGTAVDVRQLFFNVPARRRFLKTTATESGRVQEVVEAVAIARPGTAFRLTADGRTRLDLAATPDPKQRALDVIGHSIADAMLTVSAEVATEGGSPISLWGIVGRPEVARASGRAVRFALNGRSVQDRTLLHAVREAYRGLIDPGRVPVAYLALEMDPALVDVNVHPAKTEVRFRQSSFVHQVVMRAVKQSLKDANLVPAFTLGAHAHVTATTATTAAFATSATSATPSAQSAPAHAGALVEVAPQFTEAALIDNRRTRRILQVHGSYLVVEDDQGILIVDQHALHERAMFEELRTRITAGPLESQRMLSPVVMPVEPRNAEALEQLQPLLQRLGIDAAPAGPRSIAVHAFPTFLLGRRVDPGQFIPELLERVADQGMPHDAEEALHRVLDMMACKAAVKAGDHLNATELQALMDVRESIDRASACPHGRPTSLRITLGDLERQFGRT